MKLLYITYIDFGNLSSGSNVRPQKIYDAMVENGVDVHLVETQQNRYAERTKAVKEALRWVKNNDFDACYVELPSGPIFNFADIRLLKAVDKKGVPIHVFYRDAYWLLAKDFVGGKSLKNTVIEALQKRDLRVYKKAVDLFYMPSNKCIEEFSRYYRFDDMRALPPGSDDVNEGEYKVTNTGIYVGGSTKPYGVDILIEAYKMVNKGTDKYKLIIITREGELKEEEKLLAQNPWLSVQHVSGKEKLRKYYSMADCAFLPQRKSRYLDLSFGVKLFEYISYGLPIIVNDLYEMKKFVLDNKMGIAYNETPEELAAAIEKFYSSDKQFEYHENSVTACKNNSWKERALTIIEDFGQGK